ncbi:GDSL esterase/lipase At1g54790-like [Rosa rugosa]|uniref:GDSL esterase/lipase At1g54790-like n=1 Tax=Rosa rugosa TaxID=74645 RepID=UPI002B417A89|nr:GDSL esterase/lipase At1g54790-like [Rosa rugosa]
MFIISQTDLAGAFYSTTLDQILAFIPTVLSQFESGIKVLVMTLKCHETLNIEAFVSVLISEVGITLKFHSLLIFSRDYVDHGARNVWIRNTGPLGWLTQNVATFGNNPSKLDKQGCVSVHNQVAKTLNLQLHDLSKKLQGQYSDAIVTYIDIFSIKYVLIAKYSKYGFQQPIMACCGYRGPPLNYNSRVLPCFKF